MSQFRLLSVIVILITTGMEAWASANVPQKFLDRQLKMPAPQESHFSSESIQSGRFAHIKRAEWKACKKTRVQKSTFALAKDSLPAFLESQVRLRNLKDMDEQHLKIAELTVIPWSGDYWAYASGILGARFLVEEFHDHYSWIAKYEYVQAHPAAEILKSEGQNGVATLSPSEKYDLLVGNSRFGFTDYQWAQGKAYYDDKGEVESWMGICHGWAPASIIEPRPVKSVDLKSFDQKWNLHFNPSEIKGLLSYSWATNPFPVVTLGERCYVSNPKKDENGRVINPDCFDLNPATWHLAVVHRIGLQKKSFIMDATYDYEVWNQPVIGYSYNYFNPASGKEVDSLEEAIVSKDKFQNDPYAKYRTPHARSFVGITMKVGYVVESGATDQEVDSDENDNLRWVSYKYDLELDEKGNVIGGEWYQDSHPDFIWTPRSHARPLSPMDHSLSAQEWDVKSGAIPASWSEAGQVSGDEGLILNFITEGILQRARE